MGVVGGSGAVHADDHGRGCTAMAAQKLMFQNELSTQSGKGHHAVSSFRSEMVLAHPHGVFRRLAV